MRRLCRIFFLAISMGWFSAYACPLLASDPKYAASLLFEFRQHHLDKDSLHKLLYLTERIGPHNKDIELAVVIVVGYSDSNEANPIQAEALGLKRAQAAKDFLALQGVDPNRIYVESRGSKEPLAKADDKANIYKNRRVDIEVEARNSREAWQRRCPDSFKLIYPKENS